MSATISKSLTSYSYNKEGLHFNGKEKQMRQFALRQTVRWIWIVLAGAMVMGLCVSSATVAAHSFTIDQANDGFSGGTLNSLLFYSPMGQEFTPSLTTLGVFELYTEDFDTNNGIGASLFVNIRQNTITGSIIGTSSQVALTDMFNGVTHFDFPSTVSLTPGNLYVLEVVHASGDNWGVLRGTNTYPNGNVVLSGATESLSDMWFREGPVASAPVPEPSTLLLLGSGLTALPLMRKRLKFWRS